MLAGQISKAIVEQSQKNVSFALQVCIETLVLENCRVSEILRCESKNVYPFKFVILKGCKGSADIIVRDRSIVANYVRLSQLTNGKMFYGLSYQKVYNHIKSNYSHLFKHLKTAKNEKVTHAFRYLNASVTEDQQSVKSILHHNSLKSQKFYKNKSKR